MADSDITVSGLTLTSGIGHNLAKWSFVDPNAIGLDSLKLDAVELWAASTNDRSLATKVAEGRDSAGHFALVQGAPWFYWIKPRSNSARYGDWHPAGATSGVEAEVYSDDAVWRSYTPTVTPSSGAITSYSATGSYQVSGQTVLARAQVTITNNGTGSGLLWITLPFTVRPASGNYIGVAQNGSTGVMGSARASGDVAECRLYDGSYPVASSQVIDITLTYERA